MNVTVMVSAPAGARAKLRSSILPPVVPAFVAIPLGEGWFVLMSENVLGAVRLIEPSCCDPLVFTTVSVKLIVCPAPTLCGATSAV